MKNIDKRLVNTICFILLVAFVAMVVVGQKTTGYIGIATMLVGLAGLLGLLFLYNQRNK